MLVFFFFKHKTAYEMRISDWSSDVCSSDLSPSASAAASRLDLDVAALNRLMGGEGKTAGGILHYSFPRAERLMDGDMETPPTMGTATALNFQPTGDGRAAITGDFVLVANEVDPVLRGLRTHGIEVTAQTGSALGG